MKIKKIFSVTLKKKRVYSFRIKKDPSWVWQEFFETSCIDLKLRYIEIELLKNIFHTIEEKEIQENNLTWPLCPLCIFSMYLDVLAWKIFCKKFFSNWSNRFSNIYFLPSRGKNSVETNSLKKLELNLGWGENKIW